MGANTVKRPRACPVCVGRPACLQPFSRMQILADGTHACRSCGYHIPPAETRAAPNAPQSAGAGVDRDAQ